MRRVIAVALLDLKRLSFGLGSAAIVAGLIPSLALGVGATAKPGDILMLALVVVGAAAGESFGSDFAEGKSSFYFARPLPTLSLIAGRFASLLTLAAMTVAGFMASSWLSSSDRGAWSLSVLTLNHAQALGIAWSLSLFLRLAVAAHGRAQRTARGWRERAKIPVRLALSLSIFIIVFGLFADLMMRAYLGPEPAKLFMGSGVAAALLASLVAIAIGRTEGLRIARTQKVVMACYVALASATIATAWAYVLHPGPDAITGVEYAAGSPDGRYAYVLARVDRGDPGRFLPVFVLDLTSGRARNLNADPFGGPWTSADGATMAWSEASPIFLRPIWRLVGGASHLRVKTASGDVEALPFPDDFPSLTSGVDRVLPSADGSVLALQWWGGFTFMSGTGSRLSETHLRRPRPAVKGALFTPDGALRVAAVHQQGAVSTMDFMDIDPRSGQTRTIASLAVRGTTIVQFDRDGKRALVTVGSLVAPWSVTLVDLGQAAAGPGIVLGEGLRPTAAFLADGRIAVAAGGARGTPSPRSLRIFSPSGQLAFDTPLAQGEAPSVCVEMFPGILGVMVERAGARELVLFDTASATFVRRLTGFHQMSVFQRSSLSGVPSPPGSPGARLIESADGKLYDLPSPQGEPRLLLPLPRS